ncbi:Oidioi.mRNA.OKI2018_I69.chr2.g4914.t1.cds [Oikopleura dioica]|uniref:Oidioi.mRNA.OKI2018_I69.chr2.g4914.t1.cds n=1 Tax=Oikopleura dioica TaxID=34765 RepID=A0ABN7T5C3_OIKDI|nr:Oidioi.mRNA.OKI2018_I69.chr2.g4914.t1.cds [Oikopleura dioica]
MELKITLKSIVLFQWTMSLLALSTNWLPLGYMLTQFSLIILGVWCVVQRDDSLQVFFYASCTGISTVTDSILVGANYPDELSGLGKFAAAMAIIFIITKPFQALFLHQIYKERGGQTSFGNIGLPGLSSAYEDLDSLSEEGRGHYKPMRTVEDIQDLPSYQ